MTLWRWRGRMLASTRCAGRSSATRSGRSRTSPAGCGRAGSRAAASRARAAYSSTVSVGTSPVPRRSRSPEVPWWTAWLWRQLANGWKTSRPVNRPSQRFAALGRQERAVGAVVEDDEGPQQEARRRDRQGEGDPDRDLEAEVHRHGQGQVRHHRGGQVEEAAAQRGPLVPGHRLAPGRVRPARIRGIGTAGAGGEAVGTGGQCTHVFLKTPKRHALGGRESGAKRAGDSARRLREGIDGKYRLPSVHGLRLQAQEH